MLPADAVRRHGILRGLRLVLRRCGERRQDVLGVGRLGQIVHRPKLHRGNGGGDIAVAGEHQRTAIGPGLLQHSDDLKPAAVLKAHVHDSIGGRRLSDCGLARFEGLRGAYLIATGFHRFGEPGQERLVVIHNQERVVGAVARRCGECAHIWFHCYFVAPLHIMSQFHAPNTECQFYTVDSIFARGHTICTIAPVSGGVRFSAATVAPDRSKNVFAMKKPRPIPPSPSRARLRGLVVT